MRCNILICDTNTSYVFRTGYCITIITRKKTTQYKAGDTVEKVENGVTNTYKTIWVCYINDEEVSAMDEVIVKDGDVVELRIELIKV